MPAATQLKKKGSIIMAAIKVTLVGTQYEGDVPGGNPITIVGEIYLTDVGVGGGPIIPGGEHPAFPIALPPGSWPGGGRPPIGGGAYPPSAEHPIVIPPPGSPPPGDFVPPSAGDPPKPVGGLQPVNPIVVPDYILVNYPGYGWIAVAPPKQIDPTTPPAPAASSRRSS